MESEPERDIEKQLKAYARKRRQDTGAPLEMHPVTRRMLQGEVAALKPAKSADGSKKLWMRFWPRLAMAGFIFAMLGIGTWALLVNRPPAKSSFDLARNRPLDEGKSIRSKASEASPQSLHGAPPITTAPTLATDAESISGGARFKKDDSVNSNTSFGEKAAREIVTLNKRGAAAGGLAASRDRGQDKDAAGAGSAVTTLAAKPAAPAEMEVGKELQPMAERYGLVPAAPAIAGPAQATEPPFNVLADSLPSLAVNPPPAGASSLDGSRKFGLAFGAPPEPKAAEQAKQAVSAPSAEFYYSVSPQISSTQRFTLVTSGKPSSLMAKSSPGAGVLNAFVVEQTGETLRVVDGDGSTYFGYVDKPVMTWTSSSADRKDSLAEVESLKEEPAERKLGLAAMDGTTKHAQSNFFRVSGTNLSLHQPVLFTGNFVTTTNHDAQMKSRGFADKLGTLSGRASGVTSNAPAAMELRVLGRAVIGLTNQLEINAVPSNPWR
jgi:hypothetical protein